jgi:hypothetical protein
MKAEIKAYETELQDKNRNSFTKTQARGRASARKIYFL